MLNEKEIEELQAIVDKGKEAEEVLDDNFNLLNKIQKLECLKENCNKVHTITVYTPFVNLTVSFTNDISKVINQLIDEELKIINK